jgi:hypothetical protein
MGSQVGKLVDLERVAPRPFGADVSAAQRPDQAAQLADGYTAVEQSLESIHAGIYARHHAAETALKRGSWVNHLELTLLTMQVHSLWSRPCGAASRSAVRPAARSVVSLRAA